MDIEKLIAEAKERRASDIHIVCGLPVRIRVDGELTDFDGEVMTRESCAVYAKQLLGNRFAEIANAEELEYVDIADFSNNGSQHAAQSVSIGGSPAASLSKVGQHGAQSGGIGGSPAASLSKVGQHAAQSVSIGGSPAASLSKVGQHATQSGGIGGNPAASLSKVGQYAAPAASLSEISQYSAPAGSPAALSTAQHPGEIDFAGTFAGLRCRLNIFRQQGSLSSAIRILNNSIPELSTLGLPDIVPTFADFKRGIVIVTGETGSGKSTTLASLIDKVNHTRHHHIITLEDPIEYVYVPDKCTINQREIGVDTASYESGLKAILREDPDIILIGEMRSLDTIETALTAAETGHLVFATLHTNSAANTIDRIVNVFPGEKQQQIRLQLSMTLQAVIAQQLLPRASGKGRVLACEIMKTNSAIKNLIREAKTPQIANAITTSASEGNITMDNTLTRLARNGNITADTAVSAAHDVDYVKSALGIRSGAQKDRMMIR